MEKNSQKKGDELGLHRVLDHPKVLPQNAKKLDSTSQIYPNELLVGVTALQIDAASFSQLKNQHHEAQAIAAAITEIVQERGKMQNPVTGSGGMLLGQIEAIGPDYPDKTLRVGQKIATLVSLTATPLAINEIHSVDMTKERVHVSGKAILFERSLYAVLPDDIAEGAALAAFDICGAPLLTVNHVKAGQTVFILGLGKAGKSVIAGLRHRFADQIRILGADANEKAVAFCSDYDSQQPSAYAVLNAKDPIAVAKWVLDHNEGRLADVTVNLVNVANTEMPAILATRDRGVVIFFSMATDFQKAALGAEASAKDVELLIGSGYVRGHADFMLELLRSDTALRAYFEKEFG